MHVPVRTISPPHRSHMLPVASLGAAAGGVAGALVSGASTGTPAVFTNHSRSAARSVSVPKRGNTSPNFRPRWISRAAAVGVSGSSVAAIVVLPRCR